MRVKTVDIAKRLGISKATVSLALNNKPGVSESTRKEVMDCKKRMEQELAEGGFVFEQPLAEQEKENGTKNHADAAFTGAPFASVPGTVGGYIKVVIALGRNSIIREDKMNLWADVNSRFDSIAKSWGMAAEVGYFDIQKDSLEALVSGCNRSAVQGVIITGTELERQDAELFRGIRKPAVIFDSDLGEEYPCVVIDNMYGAEMLTDYLLSHGKKDILYLSCGTNAYNFLQRRTGFSNVMYRAGMNPVGRILNVGSQMDVLCAQIQAYLREHPLPDAFLAENYLLSMGLVRSCRQLGIRIPEKVSVAGIDEVPSYMLDDYRLTSLRVPHVERAAWTMMSLWKEMLFPERTKAKIMVNCEILEGNTVSAG